MGLGKLGGPLWWPVCRSVVFACHYWLEPLAPGLLGGPLVYTTLFCYQIMTLIDKMVHYIFLVLVWSVLKLVYLESEVEKCDTILHNIHPGPFDTYIKFSQNLLPKQSFRSDISVSLLWQGLLLSSSMVLSMASGYGLGLVVHQILLALSFAALWAQISLYQDHNLTGYHQMGRGTIGKSTPLYLGVGEVGWMRLIPGQL